MHRLSRPMETYKTMLARESYIQRPRRRSGSARSRSWHSEGRHGSTPTMAHVIVAKYADHLPLYRQSGIYEREGIELDRSTLAGWVGGVSALLQPLADALRQYVLGAMKLHGDDVPIPVLAPGNGKTKTGRLWTYIRDDRPAGSHDVPAVWFAYSPDRKSEHPARHLSTFRGTLQADGFAGFNRLYATGNIVEVACWAHVRRKFHDLYEAHASPIAKETLERIATLYGIEKEIRGRLPDERTRIRSAQARPLLEELRSYWKKSLTTLSRKSDVTTAIHYALGRWTQLLRYCDDGRSEIDNNAAYSASGISSVMPNPRLCRVADLSEVLAYV